MKYILITILLLSSLLGYAQTGKQTVEISKIYKRVDVTVTDGLSFKWNIGGPTDTMAHYFNPGSDQWEVVATFKKVGGVIAPVLKETINDNSTRVVYTGTWVKFTNQAWTTSFLNNDVSVSSVVNSAATVTFTGKKVSVIAEFRENHGVAKVEIKQGTTVIDSKIVDMYSATAVNAPAQIYSSATLPQGTYTVTVSLASITTGRDSMVLDSFLIFE